jgi:hypothetical protein
MQPWAQLCIIPRSYAAPRAALLASNQGDGFDQGHESGDIVCVGPYQNGGPGGALRFCAEVVLAPQLPSIRRFWPVFAPENGAYRG